MKLDKSLMALRRRVDNYYWANFKLANFMEFRNKKIRGRLKRLENRPLAI